MDGLIVGIDTQLIMLSFWSLVGKADIDAQILQRQELGMSDFMAPSSVPQLRSTISAISKSHLLTVATANISEAFIYSQHLSQPMSGWALGAMYR